MMERIAELVVKLRKPIILITAGFTVFFLFGIPKLRVESDFVKYLPSSDPAVKLFNEVSKNFKGNSIAMVIVHSDDVFSHSTLSKIDTLTRAYKGIEGVSYVMSLTDIMDIKKTEDGLEVGKLIEKGQIPTSPDSLKKLKDYVLSKERFKGQIVSEDGKYAAILIRIQDGADRERIAKEIREITEKKKGGYRIYYGGLPLDMLFIDELIRGEMGRLTPITFLILLLVLYLGFRSIWGVILPLGNVLIAVIWVLGAMGWTGRPLSMVSDAVPTILLAVGSAYGIHLLNRFFEEVREGRERKSVVKDTLKGVGIPILMAGVTTLVGFLSILSSSLTHLRDFGIFSSLGILFALCGSLLFIPVILLYLPIRTKDRKKGIRERITSTFLENLSQRIYRGKVYIVLFFAILAAISLVFLPRLTRRVNWLEYFEKGNPIRKAWQVIDEKFGGSEQVQLLLKSDNIKDPAILKVLSDLKVELEAIPYVSHPQSIADLICEMNDLINGTYTVPPTKEGVSNLWVMIEGQDILDLMITKDRKEALIQGNLATEETHIERMITRKADSIVKRIPKKILYVNEEKVPKDLKDTLKLYRAKRAAHLLTLEMNRTGLLFPEQETSLLIYKFLRDPTPKVSDIEGKLIEEFISYFMSDEADIVIEDIGLIRKLSTQLADFLSNFPNSTKEDLKRALFQLLPRKIYEEDPEALTYAASSLYSRYKNLLKRERVKALYKKVFFKNPDPFPAFLIKPIKDHLSEALDPWTTLPADSFPELTQYGDVKELEINQTGFPLIYTHLDDRLLRSQIQSLGLALVAVFILVSLEFGSILGGLFSLIPIMFTLLLNFGVMGLLRIPLDYATVIVGSISVGIGIDYTIHILSRFRKEHSGNRKPEEALRVTLGTTGKAVLINALSVAIGFMVLLFASMVPLRRAGFLLAFTMITSSLAALLLLTSVMLLREKG